MPKTTHSLDLPLTDLSLFEASRNIVAGRTITTEKQAKQYSSNYSNPSEPTFTMMEQIDILLANKSIVLTALISFKFKEVYICGVIQFQRKFQQNFPKKSIFQNFFNEITKYKSELQLKTT